MIAMINVKEIWVTILLVVIPIVPRSTGGLLYDLRYGGNEQARYSRPTYWDGALPQIDGDRNPERAAKEFCAWLIKTYILDNVAYTTKQNLQKQHKQLIQNMLQKQRLMQ